MSVCVTTGAASATSDLSNSASSLLKVPPPKLPQIHKSSSGTQRNRANKKIKSCHEKIAFKAATTLLHTEQKKRAGGLGARQVVKKIIEDFGVDVSYRTVSRYVKEGKIGESPKKNESPGKIKPWIFQTICIAVSSFVQINQVNAKSVANDRKKLNARLMSVMWRDKIPSMQLLDCVLAETATELLYLAVDNVEDRRVR